MADPVMVYGFVNSGTVVLVVVSVGAAVFKVVADEASGVGAVAVGVGVGRVARVVFVVVTSILSNLTEISTALSNTRDTLLYNNVYRIVPYRMENTDNMTTIFI